MMMKKLKPVILALGPIVLAVGIWFYLRSNASPVPSSIQLVNIVTGETSQIAQSALGSIPDLTADGKPYLYPVDKTESGEFVINERYRSDIKSRIKQKMIPADGLKVDLTTFKVSVAGK